MKDDARRFVQQALGLSDKAAASMITRPLLLGTHDNHQLNVNGSCYLLKQWRHHRGELFSMASTAQLQNALADHGLCDNVLAVPVIAYNKHFWLEPWVIESDECGLGTAFSPLKIAQLARMLLRCHTVKRKGIRSVCSDTLYNINAPVTWREDRVFGHNDLSLQHILGEVCVDWEYAGLTQRAYDIANACEANQLEAAQESDLVSMYLALSEVMDGQAVQLDYDLVEAVAWYRQQVKLINQRWDGNFA